MHAQGTKSTWTKGTEDEMGLHCLLEEAVLERRGRERES